MKTTKTGDTARMIRTLVALLTAVFAVLAAGCATTRATEPGGPTTQFGMPAPGTAIVIQLPTDV